MCVATVVRNIEPEWTQIPISVQAGHFNLHSFCAYGFEERALRFFFFSLLKWRQTLGPISRFNFTTISDLDTTATAKWFTWINCRILSRRTACVVTRRLKRGESVSIQTDGRTWGILQTRSAAPLVPAFGLGSALGALRADLRHHNSAETLRSASSSGDEESDLTAGQHLSARIFLSFGKSESRTDSRFPVNRCP